MRNRAFSINSVRLWVLGLLFVCLPVSSRATNTILSTSFDSPDLSVHIGSVVNVYLTALNSTQTFNVTSVTATATLLTINSTDLSGGGTVYITDGQRTWSVFYSGFPAGSVTVDNSNLLGFPSNPASWVVADYRTMVNQSFRLYFGTLMQGGSGSQASVDIANFDNLVLGDAGSGGDAIPSDGIWTGVYNVHDLGQIVSGAHVYGHDLIAGAPASNDGFSSPKTLDLDMLRPDIKNVAFSTNKINYSGIMYVSNFSQGKNALLPVNVDPTNAQGRFDLEVNKRDTVVDVEIVAPGGNKDLSPLIFPAQAASLNGWRIWDGSDGSNTFVADGVYPVNLYVRDSNGVVGITRTTQVRVVSLKMLVKNITLSPPVIASLPSFANGVITDVNYQVVLTQAVSGGDLGPSLRVLGWNNAGAFNQASNLGSSVWTVKDTDFLNPDGSIGLAISEGDGQLLVDEDETVVGNFSPYFTGLFGGTIRPACGLPAGTVVNQGDGNKGNDVFTSTSRFAVTSGSNLNPESMTAQHSNILIGSTPAQGSYRLSIKDVLTGLDFINSLATQVDTPDGCTTNPSPVYLSNAIHFFADARPEGSGSKNRGKSIFVEDASVIFSVLANSSPTLDNTPPVFLVSDPQDSSIVDPATYSSSKPLSAQFRDFESSVNTQPNVTFAKVKDPQGGFVGGISSTNGGGAGNAVEVKFSPYVPITTGGDYVFQVSTCNSGGLCVQKDISFKVQDKSVPVLSTVDLVPQSGPPNFTVDPLQSGAQGPFQNIDKIVVALNFANQTANTIDTDASSVSLYQISGTARVKVGMTREITFDGKLHYKLDAAITYAGQFELEALTYSKDASGQSYSGPPAGTIKPRFSTIVCTTCITALYTNNPDNSRPAITGVSPVTATLHGAPVTVNLIAVREPTSLPADAGFAHLTTANNSDAMQFYNAGAPLTGATDRLTWTWTSPASLVFKVYYDDADLGATAETALQVRGYDGSSWQAVTALIDALPSTGNSFTITPPSGTPAFLYYAIGYSTALAPGATTVPTPTALAFKNSRSFSPSHANPIYRKARFFYSEKTPKDIEVKIYDTAGNLVKSLGLGTGVKLGDTVSDPSTGRTSYFFEWDGRNDNGDSVKNGLYLARWQVTNIDLSTDTQVKPVALIK